MGRPLGGWNGAGSAPWLLGLGRTPSHPVAFGRALGGAASPAKGHVSVGVRVRVRVRVKVRVN